MLMLAFLTENKTGFFATIQSKAAGVALARAAARRKTDSAAKRRPALEAAERTLKLSMETVKECHVALQLKHCEKETRI